MRGHDEWNAATLNLIPAQERLPEGLLRLERPILIRDGVEGKLVCIGVPGIGLARGSDNDILVALINMYIDLGCPSDGVVSTTAYALLKLVGLDTSGYYYDALAQGLERVFNTTFNISEAWYDPVEKRYTTESFRIIDNLTRTHRKPRGSGMNLDSRSVLKIRLNDVLTSSIRAGYIKSLDLGLYQVLPSVGARQMYRMLDGYLAEAKLNGESMPYVKSMEMVKAAQDSGVLASRPDNMRRALERMHAPLLKHNYLAKVDFVGRGLKTRVHYTFSHGMPAALPSAASADPELVALLTARGVHAGRASSFVLLLGDQVLPVVEKFDRQLKLNEQKGSPINNKGAYMARLLDEAASIAREAETTAVVAKKANKAATARPAPVPASAAVPEPEVDEDERLAALDPEAAYDILLPGFMLKMLQARGMAIEDADMLRARFVARQITVKDLRAFKNAVLLQGEAVQTALQNLP